jgi:hypothetical protein
MKPKYSKAGRSEVTVSYQLVSSRARPYFMQHGRIWSRGEEPSRVAKTQTEFSFFPKQEKAII